MYPLIVNCAMFTQHLPHTFPVSVTGHIAPKIIFHSGQLAAVQNWEEKARNSQFSARELAKACAVSLRHMERCFKPAVGMSPQEWLNRLRMEHATVLLNNGQSVKFVALELGYKQASHFSQTFKAFYGLAPNLFKSACRLQNVAETYDMSLGHKPKNSQILKHVSQ